MGEINFHRLTCQFYDVSDRLSTKFILKNYMWLYLFAIGGKIGYIFALKSIFLTIFA